MARTIDQESQTVVGALGSVFLQQRTGVLAIGAYDGTRRLYFSRGELHLPASHPLAERIRKLLPAVGGVGEAGSLPTELTTLMDRIADAVFKWSAERFQFFEGWELLPANLVGPLPTALLVWRNGVGTEDEAELIEALGGPEGLVVGCLEPDHRGRLALDGAGRELLGILVRPKSVEQLLKGEGRVRLPKLQTLCRLRSVGLLELVERQPDSPKLPARDLASRLQDRIAAKLAERPLTLDPETQRKKLGDLLARLGELTHYEFLGVAVDSSDSQIHDGFEEVARLVHPLHAARLDLAGKEAGLELLFERATKAYQDLMDPGRRGAYDREKGLQRFMFGPSAEARDQEVKEMARENFLRAQVLVEEEEYHFALELLKQLLQVDPQPEYLALLGKVQGKNRNWLGEAAQNLSRALELGQNDPDTRLDLGRVLEKMGDLEAARNQYEKVLERVPGHPDAVFSLNRLGNTQAPGETGGDDDADRIDRPGFWRSLFRG